MKIQIILPAFLCVLLASCSGNDDNASKPAPGKETLEQLKADVKATEDSLSNGTLQMDPTGKTGVEYAERCLKIVEKYPGSKEAPVYLDRAHIIFSSCELHRRAVETGEQLLKDYPTYANRRMVLESMATAYDVFIIPRDKQKVEKYYKMMLNEYPDLPAEQKAEIEKRLANIELTFDEYISGENLKSSVN